MTSGILGVHLGPSPMVNCDPNMDIQPWLRSPMTSGIVGVHLGPMPMVDCDSNMDI